MNICYSAMLAGVDMDSVMHNGMSISEKLSFSGRMIFMGMGTVFAVLLIIWGVLSLFRVFMYDLPNKRKAAKVEEIAKTSEIPVIEKTPVVIAEPEAESAEDDKALVAVITAAISAYRSAECGGAAYALPFRVVSYKRKKSGTAWNGAVND